VAGIAAEVPADVIGGADPIDGVDDGGIVATSDSVAPSADGAVGFAASGSLFTGAAARWCHGFHQSTPRPNNTAATEITICGQGKLLTAGGSVRSLTLAGCEAGGFGACARDS
jgi:hypothetical protein